MHTINNIFQLIGKSEDDITKSIAWALCNCPSFLQNIISELLGITIEPENVVIRFQESETDKGRTDLELTDNRQFYIIIEAKKGWVLPQSKQLTMYSQRKNINISTAKHKARECHIFCVSSYTKCVIMGFVNQLTQNYLHSRPRECKIKCVSKKGFVNSFV